MVLQEIWSVLINTSVARLNAGRLRTLCPRLRSSIGEDSAQKPTPEKQAAGMVTHRQRYREKVSQMVSWGHWFASVQYWWLRLTGSRYLFVADCDNACEPHILLPEHCRAL